MVHQTITETQRHFWYQNKNKHIRSQQYTYPRASLPERKTLTQEEEDEERMITSREICHPKHVTREYALIQTY
jgi:hypothetical protein